MDNALIVTIDGPDAGAVGVPAEDVRRVLAGVDNAVRLMIEHLGGREPGPGRAAARVREQGRLRLGHARPGSFVVALTHEPPTDARPSEHRGREAIAALREWDGAEGSTLPRPVTDCLYATAEGLSDGTELRFGTDREPRRIPIGRARRRDPAPRETEEALLQGWLREVNWDEHTAQLHDYAGDHVRLRFDPALDEEMRRLATRYVEVRGRGSFDPQGDWTTVEVRQLCATRSWWEPFDLEAFINDPRARPFDPDALATINLTDEEWASFDRAIREGREV